MIYTQKQWKEKVTKDADFERAYLVNCIMNSHPESEIIEYCERLARSLKELELIERTEGDEL